MSESKDTFFAFLLGGVVGAAIGILYAPKSGKETRKNIKRLSEDIVDNVNDFSQDITKTGKRIYEEGREKVLSGKDKISEAFDAGKKAFEKYNKS
ncbi:MAG: YtxH domain-containing protein [Endomicrobium sp.]|jgi:gas vesicle protein|nr:YtxH domain-containing protein [Endomicrobium sp.]